MPSKKARSKPARSPAAAGKKRSNLHAGSSSPQTISIRWLIPAAGIAIATALACAWGTLCFLFWQGSWQLLYHPASAVVRTPANAGLAFESVGFATTASGQPQLHGWWIPARPGSRYTVLYFHGAEGNLGDSVGDLTRLYDAGLTVFAFDYRGYGQSHFEHPSERRWREDAESAIDYLTGTRHLATSSIVVVGNGLGANLALEVAAAHADLAGVVLEQPQESPTIAIFNDPRARLVPAHALVLDRWEPNAPAAKLGIPSLWFYLATHGKTQVREDNPEAYQKARSRKMLVWIANSAGSSSEYKNALSRWLDELQAKQ